MPPPPPPPPRSRPDDDLPRIVTYYQTHRDARGQHVSVLPLATQPGAAATHVIVAAVHLNRDPAAPTLNDHPPDHPRFQPLWAELRLLQAAGVKVLAMLGGASRGSFRRLDARPPRLPRLNAGDGGDAAAAAAEDADDDDDYDDYDDDDARFEAYYAPLHRLVRDRGLDGLDLDVEEDMSLAGVIRLIDRLRADFGPAFLITLAPVAAALLDARKNLSGFDYEALEVLRGPDIAWYNAQFYCGWGDLSSTLMYDLILRRGWPARKVVVGLVTNPANGKGFVPWDRLAAVLATLRHRYPSFGGVMGWEYFNSLPGDAHRPWEWAQQMTVLLRPHALRPPPPPALEPSLEPSGVAAPTAPDADPDEADGHPLQVPAPFDYYSDGESQEQ